MQTYKVIEEWETFFEFVSQMNYIKPDEICYVRRENEILIRTINDKYLEIIDKKYQLLPCDPPEFFINDGWVFVGNPRLFD